MAPTAKAVAMRNGGHNVSTTATAPAVRITKPQPQQPNPRQSRKRLAHSVTRGRACPPDHGEPAQPASEDRGRGRQHWGGSRQPSGEPAVLLDSATLERPARVAFAKSVGGQGFSILELAIVLAEFG